MIAFRLALASLAIASVAHCAPRQQRQTTCYSGVYMIVACGTEETGEGRSSQVADAVAKQIPDSGSVAVNYPASVANPPYPESLSEGITDATQKIQAYVSACGSASRIVLIGFSQGGNVMTDVMAGGSDKPLPINSTLAQYSRLN
jgi:acetylxylan esterase